MILSNHRDRVGLRFFSLFALVLAVSATCRSAFAGPFIGQNHPVVVQQDPGMLYNVSLGGGLATLNSIGAANVEYNNMGYRSTDGFLYAVEITNSGNPLNGSNNGIVRVDDTGAVTNLGSFGLPNAPASRFDAGDVSTDGTTMYISMGTQTNTPSGAFPVAGKLFTLDLTALGNPGTTVTEISISGDDGAVNDWAYNPHDGLLYGGDQADGQLAILDPTTGVRTDLALAGLPSGVGFGAAWFEPNSGHLFLYRNNSVGEVFEIDVGALSILDNYTASETFLNDGAFVIPEPTSLALIGVGCLLFARGRRRAMA